MVCSKNRWGVWGDGSSTTPTKLLPSFKLRNCIFSTSLALRSKFKSPNFESIDKMGVMSFNLSFTVENKMWNLRKVGDILNLT